MFVLFSTEEEKVPQLAQIKEAKGQTKSKLFFQADISSIKRNYYDIFSGRLVFVRFLEEIEDTKKTFRN